MGHTPAQQHKNKTKTENQMTMNNILQKQTEKEREMEMRFVCFPSLIVYLYMNIHFLSILSSWCCCCFICCNPENMMNALKRDIIRCGNDVIFLLFYSFFFLFSSSHSSLLTFVALVVHIYTQKFTQNKNSWRINQHKRNGNKFLYFCWIVTITQRNLFLHKIPQNIFCFFFSLFDVKIEIIFFARLVVHPVTESVSKYLRFLHTETKPQEPTQNGKWKQIKKMIFKSLRDYLYLSIYSYGDRDARVHTIHATNEH